MAASAAVYRLRRTWARAPKIVRWPRICPESRLNGATPIKALICRRDRFPSSGTSAIKVAMVAGPMPRTAGQVPGQVGMMGFDMPGEVRLERVELRADGLDQRLDALAGGGMADREPLMLGHLHRHELPAARDPGLQRLLLGRGQDAEEALALAMTRQHLGEFGERPSVDAVG